MSKHKSESQIIAILKEQEAGMLVNDICRKHAIGQSTFYKWRRKYGGMDVSDAKRLKELETENSRLKQMYAELSLVSVPKKQLALPEHGSTTDHVFNTAFIDIERLHDIVLMAKSSDFIENLVTEYLHDAQNIINELSHALSLLDYEHIASLAHKLGGSSKTIGATVLATTAANISISARHRKQLETSEQIKQLECILVKTNTQLTTYLATLADENSPPTERTTLI